MGTNTSLNKSCFIDFKTSLEHYSTPTKFTFPFSYEPHPLCILAVTELQQYLQTQTDWKHNFGIDPNEQELAIGKMFGVMVVQNPVGAIGYLAAFSGKLANGNQHAHFVPPIFDMLTDGSFFRTGEIEINDITVSIGRIENNAEFLLEKKHLQEKTASAIQQIESHKASIKDGKTNRKKRREKAHLELASDAYEVFLVELQKESQKEQYQLKDLKKHLAECEQREVDIISEINRLKELRKTMSINLQQRLFDQYNFLNQYGEPKNVCDIFATTTQLIPPAGAGECAAPKLLQYAFLHQLKPIAMAEFWWGESPISEIRKHGHFYPACRGKCEPILSHMLKGIHMDENPMLANPDENITLDTIYEDEHLVVIHKPSEFLSVPGINIYDSVFARMKQTYPEATGPLIVHRLDMATSGLMLIAKTKDVHQHLQDQFIKRTIKKRYVALLNGEIKNDKGFINLPIRVDLEDRPRQLVCYEHGKRAQTKYEVIERKNGQTKVYFYPLTGRTHQLRVHASHVLGLNVPIVGDDLYGTKANRLHLHAEMLEFIHPVSREWMTVTVNAPF